MQKMAEGAEKRLELRSHRMVTEDLMEITSNADCQSCGMPLSRDEQGGGTNADGSKSAVYCSHCYQNGKFTMPELTVGQMQERVGEKLKQVGVPPHVAQAQVEKIAQLGRWSV